MPPRALPDSGRLDLKVLCLLADHFWMREHLLRSWSEIVTECDVYHYTWDIWGEKPSDRTREREQFLAHVRRSHGIRPIGLIFAVAYDDFMTPGLAGAIKALGIPIVNYHVDMQNQWYRTWRSAAFYDLLCCAHTEFIEVMSRRARTAFVPMAANASFFRPLELPKRFDVLFVGSRTPERERALAAAHEVTPNVMVYGSRWRSAPAAEPSQHPVRLAKLANDLRHYLLLRLAHEGPRNMLAIRRARREPQAVRYRGPVGGFLPDEEFVSVVSSARIVLGINQRFGQIGSRSDSAVGAVTGRLRDFEVPACGAAYLVQRYPELEIFYTEGREIEGWSTLDELQQKLEFYLARPDLCSRLGRNARRRVLRDHTWSRRFRHIVHRLGHLPTRQSA